MAILVTCSEMSKHYGTRTIFEELSIGFGDDERVGFIGPNGSGKTTFLKIVAGLDSSDGGEIIRRRGARIGYLPQDDLFSDGATVESALGEALADHPMEPYERDTQVSIMLSKVGFENPQQTVETLSGGWRKRLAVAREMIQEPDLLVMDEPTNHLDLEGIQWLEKTLVAAPFAFVAVSHDRYFLERVTTRVVELNPVYPDGFFSSSGSYSMFLEKRADFLEAQQAQQVSLSNIVRREVAFLKSNSKAQRTKSKSRVEEAYRLKDELRDLQQRNAQTSVAGIDFDNSGRRTRKLLEAAGLAKSFGGRLLFTDVSLFLSPGTRVGLLGGNGSGKTTLIRVLTGDLPPDAGTIATAEGLRVVVFDQKREKLPQDVSLREALAGKNESVEFRGRNVHVTAWAKQFLFQPTQLDLPVHDLSGGEQARVLIARLMLQPADLLVLDEPTNDLDIASLDVLEESLIEFPGAVVLVTHDRYMLDRICTEILGLEGQGEVGRYADCAQWQTAQNRKVGGRGAKSKKGKSKKSGKIAGSNGLTASERNELRDMEQAIMDADAHVEACRRAAEDPTVSGDQVEAMNRWEELEAARKRVEVLYARWEELEGKSA